MAHPYTMIRYAKHVHDADFVGYPDFVKLHWQSQLTSFSIYIKGKSPVCLNPIDEIQIRTSLNTNLWEMDGRRSDMLCSVPLVGGQNTAPIDYVPPGAETRIYNAKDSALSVRSFKVTITDELNNELFFKDPYELTIAVFYC